MRKAPVRPIRPGIEPGHVDHNDGLTIRVRTCTAEADCKVNLDLHLVEWTEGMPGAIEYLGRRLLDLATELREGTADLLAVEESRVGPVWRRWEERLGAAIDSYWEHQKDLEARGNPPCSCEMC